MPDGSGRVVVFGDVIDDVIVTPRGPIRSDTDTPSGIEIRPGGSAANAATWLAHAGAQVDFVGRVGVMDIERHSRILREAGVRPMLAGDHELHTGTIVIIVNGDERNMLTERGANAAFEPDAVHDSILRGASVVHFTGYSLFGRDSTTGFKKLIKRARALGVQVSVDPGSAGFLADFGATKFLDAIAGAELLFPSLDEGKILTGLAEPVEIAESLAKKFPGVVLTLGRGGVVVAGGGQVLELDVTQANPVDPTGAGDAFCAGFLADWIVSANYRSAAAAGAALAAKAVGLIGGRPPL